MFFRLSSIAQIFQNVHRDTAGAPGMLPVFASRKNMMSSGCLLVEPPRKVRNTITIDPATKNRPKKPSIAPR